MGDYRKLDVWKLSCRLADEAHEFAKHLGGNVRLDVDQQLLPALDSVHANIAEGCGLNTDRQLVKHLRIALGSANEAEDELLTLQRRGHLGDQHLGLVQDAKRLCAMLAVFIRTVERPRKDARGSREYGDRRDCSSTADEP